jgi:hypothetical protein
MTLTQEGHFTWAEVTRSPTATRLHINNGIPPELIPNAVYTAEQMEVVRSVLGVPIHVNSWYRSPALNAAVGGAKTSAHMKALAVDFEPRGTPLMEAFHRLSLSSIPFDQLIHEGTRDGADWIHIGFTVGTPRREVLRARGDVLGGLMHFTRVSTG